MSNNFYISELAYQNLIQIAKEQGFIKKNGKNSYGLSEFLSSVSSRNFVDTRPDWVVRQHEKALRLETTPKWTFQEERKVSRFLDISDETIANFIRIGIKLGIIITRLLTNGGQGRQTAFSLTGRVIEAYGVGFIEPESLPIFIHHEKGEHNVRPRKRVSSVAKTRRLPVSNEVQEDHPLAVYIKRSAGRAPHARKTS